MHLISTTFHLRWPYYTAISLNKPYYPVYFGLIPGIKPFPSFAAIWPSENSMTTAHSALQVFQCLLCWIHQKSGGNSRLSIPASCYQAVTLVCHLHPGIRAKTSISRHPFKATSCQQNSVKQHCCQSYIRHIFAECCCCCFLSNLINSC